MTQKHFNLHPVLDLLLQPGPTPPLPEPKHSHTHPRRNTPPKTPKSNEDEKTLKLTIPSLQGQGLNKNKMSLTNADKGVEEVPQVPEKFRPDKKDDKKLKKNNKWSYKGNTLLRHGKYEEAVKCFDEALKINPNSDLTWNNKGEAIDKLGRLEEAVKCYDEAAKIDPSIPRPSL